MKEWQFIHSGNRQIQVVRKHCFFDLTILFFIGSNRNLKWLLCPGRTADCQTVYETKKGANQPQLPLQTPQLYPATTVPWHWTDLFVLQTNSGMHVCAHRHGPQTKDLSWFVSRRGSASYIYARRRNEQILHLLFASNNFLYSTLYCVQ